MSKQSSTMLKPYRAGLAMDAFNTMTWLIALGTPMVLMAEKLGATTTEVGIIYSFVFILLPVQVISTALLPQWGYKKQAMLCWAVRTLFLLIPIYLAWLAPEDPASWMLSAFTASLFLFCLIRAVGMAALFPWIFAWVPADIRGRYLATGQIMMGIAGVSMLLISWALFHYLQDYDALAIQYAIAFAGGLLTTFCFYKIPAIPLRDVIGVKEVWTLTPKLCLERSPFRYYLILNLIIAVVVYAYHPFTTYYLKTEAGFEDSKIIFYTALQFVGIIVGSLLLRAYIDRLGYIFSFKVWALASVAVNAYWLLLILGFSEFLVAMPVVFFLGGVAQSHFQGANNKYLAQICPEERRALMIAIFLSVVSLFGGISPILWGIVLKPGGEDTGIDISVFQIFFLLVIVVISALFLVFKHLSPDENRTPLILEGSLIVRPFRLLGALMHTEKENDKEPPPKE